MIQENIIGSCQTETWGKTSATVRSSILISGSGVMTLLIQMLKMPPGAR